MKKKRETVKKGNIVKRKMSDCRDGKIMTQRNGVDVAMSERERWLFITDGRIISYLFICHCESSFRAAKNRFLTNCTHTVCFSSHSFSSIQTLSNNQRMCNRRWGVSEKLGVL